MPDIHDRIENMLSMLDEDGVIVLENHYLPGLIEDLQYDVLYHEHLRFYSLTSLHKLLISHKLRILSTKKIPTHGGSLRVYVERELAETSPPDIKKSMEDWNVISLFQEENSFFLNNTWEDFRQRAAQAKLDLLYTLQQETMDSSLYAIGAPSRAVTLIHYLGLDESIIDGILEVSNSPKIGHYLPGTKIKIMDEKILYEGKVDYALLLSWHLGEPLMEKTKEKGFKGKFVIPLPTPLIVE